MKVEKLANQSENSHQNFPDSTPSINPNIGYPPSSAVPVFAFGYHQNFPYATTGIGARPGYQISGCNHNQNYGFPLAPASLHGIRIQTPVHHLYHPQPALIPHFHPVHGIHYHDQSSGFCLAQCCAQNSRPSSGF